MTRYEDSGSGFPPEETAPTLAHYYDLGLASEAKAVHASALVPNREATVDLTTWARLHYEMRHLNPLYDLHPPEVELAANGESSVVIEYPRDIHVGSGLMTWLWMGVSSALIGKDEVVEGTTGTQVTFDLKKPGVVTLTETTVALPEAVPSTTRFTPYADVREVKSGLYMASDGSSIAYREVAYEVGKEGAEEMIALLHGAVPTEAQILSDRFEQSLDAMEPSLREACDRLFTQGKDLVRDPEEMFRVDWHWGGTPVQHARYGQCLSGWLPDKLVIYAPPGVQASDSDLAFEFFQEEAEQEGGTAWTRTTWNREELPDSFHPLLDDPSELISLELEQVLAEIPQDQHIFIARYLAKKLSNLTVRMWTGAYDTPERRAEYNELAMQYVEHFPEIARQYPPPALWPKGTPPEERTFDGFRIPPAPREETPDS